MLDKNLANLEPPGTLTITTVSRPKRVVFLVHATEGTNEEVNEIVRFSSTRWGGRFNAIVPTSGDEIAPDWWKLLTAVDPDIIYSFVPLSDGLIERINRRILPVRIFEVTSEDRARRGGHVGVNEFSVAAISTYDIPKFVWARRGGLREPSFYFIRESRENLDVNVFALRNFGILPADIVTAGMFRDVPHRLFKTKDLGLKEFFGPDFTPLKETPVFPIDLSRMYSERPYSLAYESRVPGFHLVIGDTPWEAMYLWNLVLQERPGTGRDQLWLPAGSADDSDLLNRVGEWIGKVFWGDQQDRRGAVVSYSLDTGKLDTLAKLISTHSKIHFIPIRLSPGAHPFPGSFDKVSPAHGRYYAHDDMRLTAVEQVPISGDAALLRFAKPPFLSREEAQFGWMVDLGIEHRPERYFYTNVRPNWVLPKRVGMPSLFTTQGGRRVRVVSNGVPSFEVMASDQAIDLRIPSDRSVIWASCLETYRSNTEREHSQRKSQFDDLYTSDKGRHLNGILQLFGSLFHAGNFFEDPFWRSIAYRLAGRDDPVSSAEKRVQLVYEVLQTALNEVGQPVGPESGQLRELADRIANRLTFRDTNGVSMTLDELKGRFSDLRGRAIQRNPQSNYWKAHKKFDALREHDLHQLLAQSVLIQGLEIRCRYCYATQWHRVDDLQSTVQCDGCLSSFPFPANPKWSFRLNDLIGNAIRHHGTTSVLHALYHLERARLHSGMFMFLPCQDLYKKDKQAPKDDMAGISVKDGQLHIKVGTLYTDLDLVLVNSGRFTIGEVKSNPKGFESSDFDKLRTVALDLLPDEVILAAVGKSWPDEVSAQISAFTLELLKADIHVMPVLLQWWED